jgi:predicted  nucleic acid-binding Zn-ribbon protein
LISDRGLDRIKNHFEALNKSIGDAKRANMLPDSEISALKESIPKMEAQFALLEGKQFVWDANSGFPDSNTLAGMDTDLQHKANVAVLKDRLTDAQTLHAEVEESFKQILNGFHQEQLSLSQGRHEVFDAR